jgi:hypothetical protein
MKVYFSNSLCYFDNIFIPAGQIKGEWYESDTKVRFWDMRILNKNNSIYDGLITDLTKEDNTAYTNRADLESALSDFFNTDPAVGIQTSVFLTNSIIHITFTGAVYGDNGASKPIDINDFTFTYTDNSDTLIDCTALHITKTDLAELVGGETEVYFHLYLESIYDASGTAMENTETTGVLTLSSETIDFIPDLKGIAVYMDANDSTTVNEDTDFVWSDKSGITMDFSQSTAGLKPINDISTNQALNFTVSGQYLESDNPYMLSPDGFSLFFAFYKNAEDHVVCSSSDYQSLGKSGAINYIMFRGTAVLVNIVGGTGPSFTYTTPTAQYNLMEIEFTSGNTWKLYDYPAGVRTLRDTKTAAVTRSTQLRFDRIGWSLGSQGLVGRLRNVTLYNGTDATDLAAIGSFLYDKFIAQTFVSNSHRTRYNPEIKLFALWGDSNASGRDQTTDLTTPYEYILGDQTGGYIWDNRGTSFWVRSAVYNPATQYNDEVNPTDFGMEASMLYWILQNNAFAGVCKLGDGGSNLGATAGADDWIRAQLENFNTATFAFFQTEQYFKSQRYTADLQHIIFVIGYNDTVDPTLTAAFSANMSGFKTDMRSVLRKSNLKFRTHNIQNGAGKTTINNAQIALAAGDANHSHSTYTDGMVLFDGVHYDADSLVLIGKDDFDNWYS